MGNGIIDLCRLPALDETGRPVWGGGYRVGKARHRLGRRWIRPCGVGAIWLLISLFYKGKPGKIYSLQTTALGLLACWVILSDLRRIAAIGPSEGILAATDIGLFLTLAGGFSVVIGGLLKVLPEAAELNSRTNITV